MSRLAIALTILIALLAVACVGDDDDNQDTTDDEGLVSCRALEELDSYRYGVTVEAAPTPPPTGESTTTETAAPLTALADVLAQLFSNFQMSGSYVSPDRSQAILAFEGDELELRVIGDQAWVRAGEEWQEDAGGTDDLLTPVLICDEVLQGLSLSLRPAGAEPVEVNRIVSRHYELDPEKTQDLPSLLGTEVAGGYTIDLWVAEDGRWPASLLIESSSEDDEAQFRLAMDVRDVNDEGIEIEPPE